MPPIRFIQRVVENGGNMIRNSVFRNFLSLSVLQVISVLTPLILLPYVIRMVGMEKFGVLGMAMALVAYFELATDYGFDLSATRKVSLNREDSENLQLVYSSVMMLKLLFAAGGFLLLALLTAFVPVVRDYPWIYLLTYGRVFGKCLFPVWFYQGMEKMRFITLFHSGSRILFSGLTFLFLQDPGDIHIVPALQSAGVIVPGVFAQFHIQKKFGMKWRFPSMIEMYSALQEGFHIFLSRVYVNLYNSFNTLVLGFWIGYTAVGHYTLAAKVIEAVSMIFIPANNALFPHLSRLWVEDGHRFNKLVVQLRNICLIAGSFMAVMILAFNREIIRIINGQFDADASSLLSILALKLPIIALGPLYTSVLITQGRNRDYLWVVKNTFLANLLLVPIGLQLGGPAGLAVAVIIVAFFHQLLFYRKQPNTAMALPDSQARQT